MIEMRGESRKAMDDGPVDAQSYVSAILNILDDSSEEKIRLGDTQHAILNILEDSTGEKTWLESTQSAILNILDDSSEEKSWLGNTQHAILNILDDFDIEKKKVEQGNIELRSEITERKRAEEELEIHKNHLEELVASRTRELKAVNEELETFVSIAAHDLKEPMRGMQMFSQFLLEDYSDKLDETGKDYIKRINAGGERAKRLIEDLLSLSRISRMKNLYTLVASGELVKDVLDRLEMVIAQKNVKIELAGKLPLIFCDAVKIKEVFYNLISNGINYNDKPIPEVKIEAVEGQEEIKFSVRDNGIGIKKEYYEIIFQMFKRLHSKDAYGGGTGAGLAFAKKIIEEHKGRLWVESKEGRGSTFFFTIPKNSVK